jgi:hypothetical protein
MAKFVARVTAVSLEDGTTQTLVKSSKKRKVSKWLRPMEKSQRRMIKSLATFGSELLQRHDRSNRKRRNGWLRDGSLNMMRAQRKATKMLFNL